MSFITKRERVFNEYDLFDLPSRNEGKLKAYASCTDARAWSHFCSDKTEHLVEIIKRNNETCRAKYVPTDVIVDTLMVAKNAEIARLKRRMEEYEQMIAVYDQLDLDCDQKCEIAKAHSAIKAANKELDDLCLNLDLSNFTEGMDSEGFQTGKSSGDDEPPRKVMETKCNQAGPLSCPCDATTNAIDPRIDEMQDAIIHKDAKLCAMQNTIAVMENDVCEPYCIYAHIYTALEKIFGILCQNDKYRLYLDLLTSGKDTRCIDIKGRILFKLKVLEKFSLALVAPCSQEFREAQNDAESCACYRAEIVTHVETTFALTSAETKRPSLDSKRAQLVADIMEHDEMKEILGKESIPGKFNDDPIDDVFCVDDYNIETENLNRLKSLQVNYDELMICYENLKHEKECLQIRCEKYGELEKEFLSLQGQLREYNTLWNEKEHYRRRSEDLDTLKEQYLVLTEETSNLETQLRAESEINYIKTGTVEELRNENIVLEQKLNEAAMAFEKEKNALQCKLKETECKVMCQEQQIRSLSAQIDRLLEQDQDRTSQDYTNKSIALIDEIESLRDQIKNLKDALYFSEEEKEQLQEQFQDKLKLINDLKMEIEDFKSTYEKTLQRNDCLEKCTENFQNEMHRLMEENKKLSLDVEEKNTAVANLINVINNKSQEINKLMDDIDLKRKENKEILKQLREVRESFDINVISLEHEKTQVELAREESRELLEKVKDYDDIVHSKNDLSRSLEVKEKDCNELQQILNDTIEDNKRLQMELDSRENNNKILLQEVHRLREVTNYAVNSISNLEDEKNQYRTSFELTKKESEILEGKLSQFEDLRKQLQNLRESHERLISEKNKLESELHNKTDELDNAMCSIQLTKRESDELMDKLEQSENLRDDLINLSGAYHRLVNEKHCLQNELVEKNKDLENLLKTLISLKKDNEELLNMSQKVTILSKELSETKKLYDELLQEKNALQKDFDNKTEENNHLLITLEEKIEENRDLLDQIKSLQSSEKAAKHDIADLENKHLTTQEILDAVKKESDQLISKLKNYENLASDYDKLRRAHDQMKTEKQKLQTELETQLEDLKRLERENDELNKYSQNLITHNEDLEKSLINARNELRPELTQPNPYADVLNEINNMKNEKLVNNKKIRDLLDKLDESENIISNLSEEVLARDDKIAILENHINSLEDEVRQLHSNLAEVVGTGEQIKDSYHQIDQTLYKMEAHHSKATHNMKMELAKLQNENAKLEQQLSVTKQKSDESFRDKHKYASQIIHLQNEREIIITDIKQLELESLGDSVLSPENCSTEDVLSSLDKIRRCLHAKNSKSNMLEQTILKVQTSSQLLLSKADEAKRLLEIEKQKIINEKEEAITARLNMEQQLMDLKEKLEKQTRRDKGIIKDLQAEILNQKLIIDKINKSRQDYITKLQEELQSLQILYQNSKAKINELQEKVQNLSEEKSINATILDKITKDLEQKSKEVAALQQGFNAVKEKPVRTFGVQTNPREDHQNMSSQTDKAPEHSSVSNAPHYVELPLEETNKHDIHDEDITDINILKVNKPHHDKIVTELYPNQNQQSINEVQILTANIEPTFDFVKNSYMNYKLKKLSLGRLEQYSVTGIADNTESNNTESLLPGQSSDEISYKTGRTYGQLMSPNTHLVDIFNRPSMHTESSKVANTDIDNQIPTEKGMHSTTKLSAFTGFGLTNDIFESESNSNKYDSNGFLESTSGKSTDKDLFVIYRDSESNNADKDYNNKEHLQAKGHPDVLVETITIQAAKQEKGHGKKQSNRNKLNTVQYPVEEEFHEAEDTLIKPQLNINLPRVRIDSHSIIETSEGDKKSLDSFSLGVYPSPKPIGKKNVRKEKSSYEQAPKQASKLTDKDNSHSHHKLSRVGADFLLFKNKNDGEAQMLDPGNSEEPGNFGLEYILDSVQREVDPENIRALTNVRKSRSDEMFTQMKDNSSPTLCKESNLSQASNKSVTEQSMLVKIDSTDDNEKKIQYLTKALQNIEKVYKKKIGAIKMQYDSNIKSIINEHNQGVKSIQNLHEETLQDIMKIHENEVENLRSMSIEAMRKADRLEKENQTLKCKMQECCICIDEEPVKIASSESKSHKMKSRGDTRMLTKTNVEAFNVKPKVRSHGPCTCSLDINLSDTIRNIFEQVDAEQRKLAEISYMKYIANKIMTGNVEALDSQELSFLHLKVCRTWKTKLSKEEALQKRIDSLETELLSKQRHAQEHIAELDRKVAEERRRLQEVREAVCRASPDGSRFSSPESSRYDSPPRLSPNAAEKDVACKCKSNTCIDISGRRSAGDLLPGLSCSGQQRSKRGKPEHSKAMLIKMDIEERREKKLYHDEPPTRLRRAQDRPARTHKK